jgi:hypothetical protein
MWMRAIRWSAKPAEMADDGSVRLVAMDQIRMRGPNAVNWLVEQAELADGLADHEAAKAWRDIAAAAQRILQDQRGPRLGGRGT